MIEIRSLHARHEMQTAVDIQKVYWGDDPENLVPAHMLFSIVNYGGHVLAAMDGDTMVGVLIGFLGTNIEDRKRPAMANLLLASKRMVVLPQYRGQGVGYRLKLAQRDIAIQQGVRLINWTFDPLVSRNAYLNIRKLGCVTHRYETDYYADGEDRVVVDWWVTSRRVEERLNGSRGVLTLRQYLETGAPIYNPTRRTDDGGVVPGDELVKPQGSFALVEIPQDFESIAKLNPTLALRWRHTIRDAFRVLLSEGFIVTDFVRESHEGRERTFYVFSFSLGLDFSQN